MASCGQPMRVILCSFPAITLLGGGVETQVRSLARELASAGCEAELFDPWKKYDFAGYDLFHLFAANIGTYHLGRAIRRLRIPLIVSPEFYSRHCPSLVRSALLAGVFLRRLGGFWTEHVICRELCEMADMLLPNTKAEAKMIERGLGVRGKRTFIFPNGVDERFAYASPDEFASAHGEGFILYVGHIGWARKNLLPLLEVIEELRHPAVLIGRVLDTEYGHRCMEVARRSGCITVLPPMSHSSTMLASAYAACSVVVLPSLYETPGLVALEAALAGARICITSRGGTTEYFGSYVDYIEPGSKKSIRVALLRALARPKDGGLRDHVAQNYLWRHAAERALEAYSVLLS